MYVHIWYTIYGCFKDDASTEAQASQTLDFCKTDTMMALRPMDIPLDRLRLQFEGSDEDGAACETAAPSNTAHAGQASEERTHEAAEALDDGEWDEDEGAEGGLDWEVSREGACPATPFHPVPVAGCLPVETALRGELGAHKRWCVVARLRLVACRVPGVRPQRRERGPARRRAQRAGPRRSSKYQ
jgi:hypothetical protein